MKIRLKEYLSLFSKYLKNQWISVLVMVTIILINIGIQIMNPQIMKVFLDKAVEGEALRSLMGVAGIFIGLSFVQHIVNILETYTCQNVGWRATNGLREELISHCINLDMDFHKTKQPGEMIERVDGDVNMLFEFFSKLVLDILNNLILMIGVLIMFIFVNPVMGGIFTVYTIISLVVIRKYQLKGVAPWEKCYEAEGKFWGMMDEELTNIEDIKSSGAVNYAIHKYLIRLKDVFHIKKKATMIGFRMWNLSTFIKTTGIIIALGSGLYLWKYQGASIGTIYLIYEYTKRISNPLNMIRRRLVVLQKAEASILRVKELFEIKSSIKDGDLKLKSHGPLDVDIKNLSFEYTEGIPVLKDISLNIKSGKIIGILGRTGSGKTTLVRLLSKLYEPTKGEIVLGGMPLGELSNESVKDNMAYVTQDVHIYTSTIRDNLTLFDSSYSDEQIICALKELGLDEWIKKFPLGLDTVLNTTGAGLSSGEAQLLAFARILLKKPGLVILDEASSRIDTITEKIMEKAIDKITESCTCIIIAHRLSTVNKADSILVLEEGQIVELGEREELIKDSESRYSKLIRESLKGHHELLVN
ncbi:ABC transporter ATP-binding protein [Oceanirhabdus sp. W0125-5]|uniref:ABC transporter ATP-binding protein n=1 Tax=Oceanirhabdus sp. W0125-5 TaxID=2999116 RepID=UPI0022F3006C|nr:ABC transporter ATP-binding protein [Oceanirhabdus sp. W0125-5]WBW96818.1 ABC transporter ATP-binding protein [Oceanirhabdus sp. W0125-5]